ncbi:MAG TPA: hypothetical protein VKU02_32785 [Gemmataceae bacterium]|nr:hypothetical protein [Gemmataceae bacterium]
MNRFVLAPFVLGILLVCGCWRAQPANGTDTDPTTGSPVGARIETPAAAPPRPTDAGQTVRPVVFAHDPSNSRALSVPAGSDMVTNGRNLQAAIDNALPGDVIELDAGGIYLGPILCRGKLPASQNTGPAITIRTRDFDQLHGHPAGKRVTPADAKDMAVILAPGSKGEPSLRPGVDGGIWIDNDGTKGEPTGKGYGFWTLMGLEIRRASPNRGSVHGLLVIGNNDAALDSAQDFLDKVPHDILIDRCYIHGLEEDVGEQMVPGYAQRGITVAGRNVTIDSCDIREISSPAVCDGQGIYIVNTPGPVTINNCAISAEHENLLVGGDTSKIQLEAVLTRDPEWIHPGTNVTFSPSAMRGVLGTGQSWAILYNSWLGLDDGTPGNQEFVRVLSTTGSTFTVARVTKPHDGRQKPFAILAAHAGGTPQEPNTPSLGMDLVPAHLTITNNTFEKPLKYNNAEPQAPWRKGQNYVGKYWYAKNLLELKAGSFVTIKDNIFQNNWYGSDQYGFAILFTPRGRSPNPAPGQGFFQGGPWTTVDNVTFTHNIVRHCWSGIQILACDQNGDTGGTQLVHDVLISQNVFDDMGDGNRWAFPKPQYERNPPADRPVWFHILTGKLGGDPGNYPSGERIPPGGTNESLGGTDKVWITHNTFAYGQFVSGKAHIGNGKCLSLGGVGTGTGFHTNFRFNDNICAVGSHGIFNEDTGGEANFPGRDGQPGMYSKNSGCPGGQFLRNVLYGGRDKIYQAGWLSPDGPNRADTDTNYYPSNVADVGFVDFGDGNVDGNLGPLTSVKAYTKLRLDSRSKYLKAGSDGTRPGASSD